MSAPGLSNYRWVSIHYIGPDQIVPEEVLYQNLLENIDSFELEEGNLSATKRDRVFIPICITDSATWSFQECKDFIKMEFMTAVSKAGLSLLDSNPTSGENCTRTDKSTQTSQVIQGTTDP